MGGEKGISPSGKAKPIHRDRGASSQPRETIRIWLDNDIIERFRATGPGWKDKINNALRRADIE
jgi:uncharacterized protein (DUF4415 family)